MYLQLHDVKNWMTMICLHVVVSFGIPEENLVHEPRQALLSKGKFSLDDEQEKFHPNAPEGIVIVFEHRKASTLKYAVCIYLKASPL